MKRPNSDHSRPRKDEPLPVVGLRCQTTTRPREGPMHNQTPITAEDLVDGIAAAFISIASHMPAELSSAIAADMQSLGADLQPDRPAVSIIVQRLASAFRAGLKDGAVPH